MTPVQWVGAILFVVLFFGSIGLGRYLRRKDAQHDKKPPVRAPRKTPPVVVQSDDSDRFRKLVSDYQSEMERIAWGYNDRFLMLGESAANQWLREQIGQSKPTP